jgi:SAM-dependent methyltransferase
MKLHLGCGLHAPSDWINIDCSMGAWFGKHRIIKRLAKASRLIPAPVFAADWPANILFHDLRKPLPFTCDSISAIYSSNTLEHLYKDEAERLLEECYRVLRPSGVLRIVVPDLALIVKDYCTGASAESFNDRLGFCPQRNDNSILNIYYRLRNTDHKFMYDERALSLVFAASGFSNISRRSVLNSRIPDIATIERAEHFTERHDLCIEGIKPA